MMRWFATLLAMAGLSLLAGCGGSGAGEADVSGNVTIDGKPLATGDIIFESTDGSQTPARGQIKDGLYGVKTVPGSKKVKITASRPSKKIDPTMGAAPQEALVGPNYNSNTQLTAELKAGKNAGVNFEVKALP